jgi:hypothetical protein
MTRICRKCGKEKEISEFQHTHFGRPWSRHTCNTCESLRKQAYYNRNIERIRAKQNGERRYKPTLTEEQKDKNAEYARNYRHHLKALIYSHYGNKCACCGETEEKFLSLDHVNNDGYTLRKMRKHTQGTQFYVEIVKRNFPSEFQLLCMNCNFGKSRNGGVCPHESRLRDYPEREYTQAGGSAPDPLLMGHDIVPTA